MLPEGFALVVRTQAGTGPVLTFTASPRDLSASGMGFYHTAYIHPGTPVRLLMRTLRGEAVAVVGTVARCRHASGRIHEVGVAFENEIEVGQFVQGTTVSVNGAGISEDMYTRAASLVADLKAMVDQRATQEVLFDKVGQLAALVSPGVSAQG
jgi:hypothetical protein